MKSRYNAVFTALTAAALFGAATPLAKALLGSVSPFMLAGLFYLGSGLGLGIGIVWRAFRSRGLQSGTDHRISKSELPWLIGAIATGGVAGPAFLMLGLASTPAATSSLLLNLEGVLTAVIAWVVFRENVDVQVFLGMAAIVAGGVILSWHPGQVGVPVGALLIVGACMCWAIDNNLTQKVSAGDPVQTAMLKGMVAGSINTTIAVFLGASWPSAPRVTAALIVGFLSYGVSLVLFVISLRQLGTARTGAYFSTAPFVGALLSLLIFREQP
ncbi:MAG: DMT family transporter, partial [Paraburkholderia graminis]|uniref:DMT family transporter n=1 Tax=Paraburkholderia graminis TaxID=60548 RepID=UPI00389ACC7C